MQLPQVGLCIAAICLLKNSLVQFLEEYEPVISAITGIGLVLCTALLAVATVRLWTSTRDLVNGAERTAERQLRAYVSLPTVEIQNFGAGREMKVVISVLNSGQTPAYRVRCNTAVAIAKFPDDGAPLLRPVDAGNGHIGPSAHLITGITLHQTLSVQQMAEIKAGILAIYIRAQVLYWDAFGKQERYVNYRGFHKRGPGAMPNVSPTGELLLQQTKDGNDAN